MSNGYKDCMNDRRVQFDINTEMLNCLPEGWAKSFVPKMRDELFNALGIYAEDFYITEAKEKWAAMRVYWNFGDREYCEHEWADLNEISVSIYEIIAKYTDISFNTCMICGAKADSHTRGYVIPVCDICNPIKVD